MLLLPRVALCWFGRAVNDELAGTPTRSLAAGKPASKKWFGDIPTAESKLNGRITEEYLLLKTYK